MPKFIASKKFTGVKYSLLNNGDKSYYIVYKVNNKPIQVYIGKDSEGVNEQFCWQKRNEALNKARFGDDTPIVKGKNKKIISFDEIANIYFSDKELHNKENKRLKARYDLHIKKHIGFLDINDITQDDIAKIQKDLASLNKSPTTINLITGLIKTIFNHAIKKDIFKQNNPAIKVDILKIDNERERFLTKEEVEILFEAIKNDEELNLFVNLSLSTGGRLGTILNITKKDIDLRNDIITLKNIKNNNTYKGFINPQTKTLLVSKLQELSPNDKIIKMPERTLQRKMQNIFNEMFNEGVMDNAKNKVVLHTLRHTFASLLAIDGTPIFTIQKLLDHKDISDTLRYAKLAPDTGKDAVKNLFLRT